MNSKELDKKLRADFASCLTCKKGRVWPFQPKKDKACLEIRCSNCTRKLNKVWFDSFFDYIAVFRGQV